MSYLSRTRRAFTAALALLLLVIATTSLAQPATEPTRKYSLFSDPDIDPNEEESTVIETEFTTRIEIPGIEIVPCQAQVELAYYQRNNVARVDATISHKQCEVVTGSFDVLVSVRSSDDDLTRYTFPEVFTIEEAGKTAFRRDYPIGNNVTLGSVRSTNVQCECRETGTN